MGTKADISPTKAVGLSTKQRKGPTDVYNYATIDNLAYRSLPGFSLNCRTHAAPNRAAPTELAETLEVLSVQPQDKSEMSAVTAQEKLLPPQQGPEWRPFYQHWHVPVVARSQDFEVWHYGPERNLGEILPKIEEDSLECSGQHLQAIQTAQKTLDSFSADLGRDFTLSDQPMPIVIGHPQVQSSLPFYQQAPFKCIGLSHNADYIHPDAISHETGHAILDSRHNYDYKDFETAAVHEAFADCCSLLAAWHEPPIIWDILRQRALGLSSNKLTTIGENLGPSSDNYPIRDLSQAIDSTDKNGQTPHEYSQQFTQAFYQCLLAWEKYYQQACHSELRQAQPIPPEIERELASHSLPIHLEQYQALALACHTLGRHFANALYLLPQTDNLKLDDLSQALLDSGKILEKDSQISQKIYSENLPFSLPPKAKEFSSN